MVFLQGVLGHEAARWNIERDSHLCSADMFWFQSLRGERNLQKTMYVSKFKIRNNR